jgi:hypothetical protein
MSEADQFRQYAEEAMGWVAQSKTEKEKRLLLELDMDTSGRRQRRSRQLPHRASASGDFRRSRGEVPCRDLTTGHSTQLPQQWRTPINWQLN